MMHVYTSMHIRMYMHITCFYLHMDRISTGWLKHFVAALELHLLCCATIGLTPMYKSFVSDHLYAPVPSPDLPPRTLSVGLKLCFHKDIHVGFICIYIYICLHFYLLDFIVAPIYRYIHIHIYICIFMFINIRDHTYVYLYHMYTIIWLTPDAGL